MESSLFNMIKKTTRENLGKILSAYKDNVAFAQGPVIEQFAPKRECHLSQGRDPQLPDDRRTLQWCRHGHGR